MSDDRFSVIHSATSKFFEQELHSFAGTLPPFLYHYTSPEGMLAITRGQSLRAYELTSTADFVELRFAASIFRAHIDRAFAVEPNPVVALVFDAMRQAFERFQANGVFSISFSTLRNSHNMWKLYASNSTGFSFAVPLGGIAKWAFEENQGGILRCQYGEDVLNAFCLRSLHTLRNQVMSVPHENFDAHLAQSIADRFLDDISWFAPIFKPAVFHDEDEFRLIFRRFEGVQVDEGKRRHFVPFPIKIDDGQSNTEPIRAICAGVSCNEQAIMDLQVELHSAGAGKLSVIRAGDLRKAP